MRHQCADYAFVNGQFMVQFKEQMFKRFLHPHKWKRFNAWILHDSSVNDGTILGHLNELPPLTHVYFSGVT